jgi:hypothetical protein
LRTSANTADRAVAHPVDTVVIARRYVIERLRVKSASVLVPRVTSLDTVSPEDHGAPLSLSVTASSSADAVHVSSDGTSSISPIHASVAR